MSQHHPQDTPHSAEPTFRTPGPCGDETALPHTNGRTATGTRILLLLAVIGCTTLLTGCIIYPEGAYYRPAYGPYYGQSGYGYGDPYYTYGGLSYYYSGGRYFYYRNHQRCYVSGLPHGGHYNRGWSANRGGYSGAAHNLQGRTGYQQQQQYRHTGARPSGNVGRPPASHSGNAGHPAASQRGTQPAKGGQPSQSKGGSKSKQP